MASRVAFAEEPERLVVLTIEGPEAEAAELAATVSELTARMHVRTVRSEPPEGTEILAHVRVDLRARASAHVELAGKHGQRPLSRDVSRAGSPAIARETIAHTIRAGVEAQVFEEERIAAEEQAKAAEPPPSPPPPPVPAVAAPVPPPPRRIVPPSSPSPGWGADFGVFAAGGPIASDSGVAPRVGVLAAVGKRSRFAPTLQVSAAYAPPFETDQDAVLGTRVWLVPVRVTPSIAVLRVGRFDLVVGAGLGLDVLHVEPRSDVLPRSVLRDATTRVDPIVTGALSARVALVPRVYVFAAVGADLDLASRPYVVQRGSTQETLFEPWRVRPTVTLGIAFSALGAPHGVQR